MRKITRNEMLSLYATGLVTLLFQAALISWFGTTLFYLVGLASWIVIPAGPVLGHIFTSSLFLGLFPNQNFWTIRVLDRHFQLRTVIGALSEIELYHGQTD